MKTAPALIQWFLKLGGFRAVTLPPFGIYAVAGSEGDERLARHEGVHWQQYERMGAVMFYLTYLYQMVRYGYRKAPMEVEARNAE